MIKKSAFLLSLLCLAVGMGTARAASVPDFGIGTMLLDTTAPNSFTDPVDWCVNFTCVGQQMASPQPWTSNGGNTGLVGLVGTLQGFYVLQQGTSWFGNFPNGMGVIYNGASFGNTPTDIAAVFSQGLYGAGADIQTNSFGPFAATITLFDSNFQPLGSVTLDGVSNTNPGSALFISDYISSPNVWAVQFDAVPITVATPEPSSVLMLAPALLGWLGIARSRLNRKSEEVLQ